MRSLYLEGYNYSIFYPTKPDRVQIKVFCEVNTYQNFLKVMISQSFRVFCYCL
uniref:Uncharacterized protein n=1 Tax=Nelumbo nucifera TaxID=4432 RepID=A0A822ZSE7_NELNU|nr:TPA_asm: hypothetical protein HUJ06_004086 [Nelumbo nucifera]